MQETLTLCKSEPNLNILRHLHYHHYHHNHPLRHHYGLHKILQQIFLMLQFHQFDSGQALRFLRLFASNLKYPLVLLT